MPFLFDYYAKVTDNEIAINKFMGFGETVYPYDKVMELKLVKSQKNGKGEIIRRRYHEIVFDNGYVFSFDHSNYNLNWKKESEIMNFIAKKCCTEIQVIDPYPKRTL
ncbi:MAG: hypothetical protein NTW55_03675 [Planctomycetota bacterium]|nr:hypothetical protein [Planctomycetota bacterium]